MLKQDKDGKYPLSDTEWTAMRTLLASLNAMMWHTEEMRDRARLVPGTYRDLKMLEAKVPQIYNALICTVPDRKRAAIQAELQNSQIQLKVKGATADIHSVVYVDEDVFVGLMDRLISMECWSCSKSYKASRKCPIMRAVCDVIHYDKVDQREDGECPLVGKTSIVKDEKEAWEDD